MESTTGSNIAMVHRDALQVLVIEEEIFDDSLSLSNSLEVISVEVDDINSVVLAEGPKEGKRTI